MFNTLHYAKMLEEVGFTREQSETSVKILVEIMEDKLASKQDLQDFRTASKQDLQDHRIATKQDLKDLRVEVKQEIQDLRVEVKQEIQDLRVDMKHSLAQLESKLTIRMGVMLTASIGVLAAIQKLV